MTKPTNSNHRQSSTAGKQLRRSRKAWVRVDQLRTNPVAQREFSQAWAEKILSEFDPDKLQMPHVNKREDGSLYVVDGQHGSWAYGEYFGQDQKIEVHLYDNLTEQEEADLFLALNNKKPVGAMAKFKVAVTAGHEVECDIDRIVRIAGCHVSNDNGDNSIGAVGALLSIYNRHGAANLRRTLGIIGDSFSAGYERPVLLGVSMVLARYPGLDVERLVIKLSGIRSGWKGLIQRATLIKEAMGCPQAEAAAAAVVETYNAGRGGKKLPSWWREDATPIEAIAS